MRKRCVSSSLGQGLGSAGCGVLSTWFTTFCFALTRDSLSVLGKFLQSHPNISCLSYV